MDRRTTIKWVIAASAAVPAWRGVAAEQSVRLPVGAPAAATAEGLAPSDGRAALGYGTDPDLMRIYHPGELWPLALTAAERRGAAALCDVIIPSDEHSPGASAVGVVDFLDEWISAPYSQHVEDRALLQAGLRWLDQESLRRFKRSFAELADSEHKVICDLICDARHAPVELAEAARFFARYRDLTAGGFYSCAAGRADIGYIGNVPMPIFDGPPEELKQRLGLAAAAG